LTNSYPLPLTFGFTGSAYAASLRPAGGGAVVWSAVADDPQLEQMSDSPAGGMDRAGVVPVGTTRPQMSWPLLLDLQTYPLPPGTYELRVRAYGVESQPLAVRIGPSSS
jgi:hypothetical protein